MPQVRFAVGTAESTAKVSKLGQGLGDVANIVIVLLILNLLGREAGRGPGRGKSKRQAPTTPGTENNHCKGAGPQTQSNQC